MDDFRGCHFIIAGSEPTPLLVTQLLMLYDGATVAADLDSYPDAVRAAAEHLIDLTG